VGMWATVETGVSYMGNAAQLEVGQVQRCALGYEFSEYRRLLSGQILSGKAQKTGHVKAQSLTRPTDGRRCWWQVIGCAPAADSPRALRCILAPRQDTYNLALRPRRNTRHPTSSANLFDSQAIGAPIKRHS
jgi:hypothetical protein